MRFVRGEGKLWDLDIGVDDAGERVAGKYREQKEAHDKGFHFARCLGVGKFKADNGDEDLCRCEDKVSEQLPDDVGSATPVDRFLREGNDGERDDHEEQAGTDLLLLECVPASLAAEITEALEIPVIGIGAGADVDGQILVLHDILNVTVGKKPKFSKNFMQDQSNIQSAISRYVHEVKRGQFPDKTHAFS